LEIKDMLSGLGILCKEPYTARTYQIGGVERTVMGVFISDYANMERFHEIIGFSQKERNARLLTCLNRKGGENHIPTPC
jgi:hypothetical protein